ncbi:MAG: DUF2953 domain-containing protein [Clostridia bacterium]|nr:DUF2953 domain-containing protein [Clostridia bacterium]
MIWLFIIAIIFLGIAFLPISVNICFDKGLKFRVKVLLFDIFTYPDSNEEKQKSKTAEPGEDKETSHKDFLDKISLYIKISRELLSVLKNEFKSVKIKEYVFEFVCGTGDAAMTGIFFGAVYAVLNPFHRYFFDNFRIKKKEIEITPDFENKCIHFSSSIKFNITLYWLIKLFFKERNVFNKIINNIKKDGV